MNNNEITNLDINEAICSSEEILSELTKKSAAIRATLSIKTLKSNLTFYIDKFAG